MVRERLIYALLFLAVLLLIAVIYRADDITPWIERLTRPIDRISP